MKNEFKLNLLKSDLSRTGLLISLLGEYSLICDTIDITLINKKQLNLNKNKNLKAFSYLIDFFR